MNNKKIVLSIYVALVFGLNTKAQEAITTSGSLASGSNGTINYTVGQITYCTAIGINGSSAQGIQQSYDILIISGSEDSKISLDISVYPNPTNDYLKLKTESGNVQSMSYLLCDMLGKPLKNRELKETETLIEMTDLVPSIYFVRVLDNHQVIKTFKIIKH